MNMDNSKKDSIDDSVFKIINKSLIKKSANDGASIGSSIGFITVGAASIITNIAVFADYIGEGNNAQWDPQFLGHDILNDGEWNGDTSVMLSYVAGGIAGTLAAGYLGNLIGSGVGKISAFIKNKAKKKDDDFFLKKQDLIVKEIECGKQLNLSPRYNVALATQKLLSDLNNYEGDVQDSIDNIKNSLKHSAFNDKTYKTVKSDVLMDHIVNMDFDDAKDLFVKANLENDLGSFGLNYFLDTFVGNSDLEGLMNFKDELGYSYCRNDSKLLFLHAEKSIKRSIKKEIRNDFYKALDSKNYDEAMIQAQKINDVKLHNLAKKAYDVELDKSDSTPVSRIEERLS